MVDYHTIEAMIRIGDDPALISNGGAAPGHDMLEVSGSRGENGRHATHAAPC
jgi:hypothetical protein